MHNMCSHTEESKNLDLTHTLEKGVVSRVPLQALTKCFLSLPRLTPGFSKYAILVNHPSCNDSDSAIIPCSIVSCEVIVLCEVLANRLSS